MIKGIFIIGILCLALVVKGQQINVTIGGKLNAKEFNGSTSLMAGDKYLDLYWEQISLSKKIDVELRLFDRNTMALLKKISINDRKNRMLPIIATLMHFGKKIFLVYEENVNPAETGDIVASEIDLASLALSKPIVIAHLKNNKYLFPWEDRVVGRYTCTFSKSPNQKQNLLFITGRASNECYVSLLDESLNIIREKKETFFNSEREIKVFDACTDNQGMIYTSYGIYPKRKENPRNDLNYVAVLDSKDNITEHRLDIGTLRASSIRLLPAKKQQGIHFAGYYYNNELEFLTGAFYGTLSASGVISNPILKKDLPETLVEELDKDGWAKKNKGMQPAIIPLLYELENGDVSMMGAFRQVKDGGVKYQYDLHNTGSTLNVWFSGKEAFFYRIPRSLYTAESPTGDGLFVLPFNDTLILIYNDHEDNSKKDLTDKPSSSNFHNNAVTIVAKIKPDGSISRQLLIDQQKENFLAVVDEAKLEDSNQINIWMPLREIKMYGRFGGDFKWAKITIK